MKVEIKQTAEVVKFGLPEYSTSGAAGVDLVAVDSATIQPGRAALIPTGIYVAVPPGYEIQVRPRSGLALKYAVTVLNAPGTIDSDYRGSIGVVLINHGSMPFHVLPGQRIAQAVLTRYEKIEWKRVDELSKTQRGEGGFGHTGV